MLLDVPVIDDTTLAAARATLAQLHTTSATHGRLAETVNSSGEAVKSWTSLGTISCRVETDMGDMDQARVMGTSPSDRIVYDYVVFVAHNADVRTGDRLTLASGVALRVEQASREQSQAFVRALQCTEVAA